MQADFALPLAKIVRKYRAILVMSHSDPHGDRPYLGQTAVRHFDQHFFEHSYVCIKSLSHNCHPDPKQAQMILKKFTENL